MPEIWLNYGITDVVLDIRAENLEQKIDSDGKILEDTAIFESMRSNLKLDPAQFRFEAGPGVRVLRAEPPAGGSPSQ